MNITFSHDFAADLSALDFNTPDPWALVRFADGERAILEGRDIQTADGWTTPGLESEFTKALWESLLYCDQEYHIGFSCPCCDGDSHNWFRARSGTPSERQTFSNIFCNANTQVAHERLKLAYNISVGILPDRNCVNDNMTTIDRISNALADTNKHIPHGSSILVAAGPASNIIIHRYWRDTPPDQRRTIVDIGSALDPLLRGKVSRGYHMPNHPNRTKVCRWS